MFETFYMVLVDNHIVARNMPLNYALLLVEAVFEKYYAEANIKVSITPEPDPEDVEVE